MNEKHDYSSSLILLLKYYTLTFIERVCCFLRLAAWLYGCMICTICMVIAWLYGADRQESGRIQGQHGGIGRYGRWDVRTKSTSWRESIHPQAPNIKHHPSRSMFGAWGGWMDSCYAVGLVRTARRPYRSILHAVHVLFHLLVGLHRTII